MSDIWSGVVIGGAGGAVAGVTVWLVQYAHRKTVDRLDRRRVHRWLRDGFENKPAYEFRSTRAIASWTNLTQERVREVCSADKRIYLSTGEKEDRWSLYEYTPRSVSKDPKGRPTR